MTHIPGELFAYSLIEDRFYISRKPKERMIKGKRNSQL